MKKQVMFLFAAVLMLSACSSDREYCDDTKPMPGEMVPASPVFNASIDDDSRASVVQGNVLWDSNDQISVFLKRSDADVYKLSQGAGTSAGVFKPESPVGEHQAEFAHYVAIHPCNNFLGQLTATETGYKIPQANIRWQQDYAAESNTLANSLMAAVSKDTNLKFKNIAGLLKLSLKSSSETENIVSSIKVSRPSGDIPFVFDLYIDNPDGDIQFRTDTANFNKIGCIELNIPNNIKLTEKASDFYVALLPMAYEQGLKIEIINDKGEVISKLKTKPLEIKRNEILSMPAVDLGKRGITVDAAAHSVNCGSAGILLQRHIEQAAGNSKQLVVTGSINGADIKAIREAVTGSLITSLDLSGANIVASNDFYLNNFKITDDNTIGDNMFNSIGLESIKLPVNTTAIGDGAFSSTNITEIDIPAGVAKLGENCFFDCQNLSKVNFKGNLIEAFPINLFSYCPALKSITIPSSVKSIGDYCFNSSGLEALTIPSAVVNICSGFIDNCESLTMLTMECKKADTTIEPTAFLNFNTSFSCDLRIDESWIDDIDFYANNFYEREWKSISRANGKPFCDIDAATHTITTLAIGNITPEAISEAVGNGSVLKIAGKISGEDLRFIREATGCTFNGGGDASMCKVKTLDLSEAIVQHGGPYMRNSYISLKRYNIIPEKLFYKSFAEKIILPKIIAEIDFEAFAESKIKSLVVPESVTQIFNNIVRGCPVLTAIQIKGSPVISGTSFNGFTNSTNCILYLNESFENQVTGGNVFKNQTWKKILFGGRHDIGLDGITDADML